MQSAKGILPELPVKSKDEMGIIFMSFNNTVAKVRDLIKDVLKSVDLVTNNSEELNASSNQISMISQEVAHVIEEIAISASRQAEDVKQGSDMAIYLGDKIRQLSSLAEELTNISTKMEGLKDKGVTFNEIVTEKSKVSNQSIGEVYRMVNETNDSAKRINEIISVINGIADQTNLLALNASIESARAGEAGRGFMVVADEIRKLATQSAESVSTIQTIIKDLQHKSDATVETMLRVKQLIDEQTESVEDTKHVFMMLAGEIEASRTKVTRLSSLEGEIVHNKEEIINSFNNLALIAEENAASTQEASASTEEQTASIADVANSSNRLSEMAINLKNLVNQFKV